MQKTGPFSDPKKDQIFVSGLAKKEVLAAVQMQKSGPFSDPKKDQIFVTGLAKKVVLGPAKLVGPKTWPDCSKNSNRSLYIYILLFLLQSSHVLGRTCKRKTCYCDWKQ